MEKININENERTNREQRLIDRTTKKSCSPDQTKIYSTNEKLIDEEKIVMDYSGHMKNICVECGEKYNDFNEETTTKERYHKCCRNGQIILDCTDDYPKVLKELMNTNNEEGKNYRENIREYNNKLAFGNFIASIDILPTKGPLVY